LTVADVEPHDHRELRRQKLLIPCLCHKGHNI
jgi:hypothetical protein